MGYKGHKGAIGLPGNYDLPKYVIDIINFRNEKYNKDLNGSVFEETDKKYDIIDNAINQLVDNIMRKNK